MRQRNKGFSQVMVLAKSVRLLLRLLKEDKSKLNSRQTVLMDYFTPVLTTENVEGMDLEETIDDEYSS